MNHTNKQSGIAGYGSMGARLLLAGAALVSLYLASISLSQTGLSGCGEGSPCYRVLFGKWAYAFGIPVSMLGLIAYCGAIILAGKFENRTDKTWLSLIAECLMATIALAALWFVGLQLFVLKEFCPWCGAAHLMGVSGVVMLTLNRSARDPIPAAVPAGKKLIALPVFRGLANTFGIALALGILIGGPILYQREPKIVLLPIEPASKVKAKAPAGTISLHNGRFILKPDSLPIIGKASAKQFAVALLDYTCDFCRDYHKELIAVQKARGDDFAFLVLPAHRDANSREIQETMLTLFKCDPAAHAKIAERIYSGEIPPQAPAVQRAAAQLLGAERFTTEVTTNQAWTAEQIKLARSIQDANKGLTNNSRLPQIMAGGQVLIGYYPQETVGDFLQARGSTMALSEPGHDGHKSATDGQNPLSLRSTKVLLGEVKPGQRVPCEVEFQNTGSKMLKLGWVSLEPGCEVTHMPSGPIPPGVVAKITFLVDAPSSGSAFERTVRINGANENGPQITSVVKIGGQLTKNIGPANPVRELPAVPLPPAKSLPGATNKKSSIN